MKKAKNILKYFKVLLIVSLLINSLNLSMPLAYANLLSSTFNQEENATMGEGNKTEEDVTIEEGSKTEEDVTIEEGNKTEEDATIEEGSKTEEDVTIEEGNKTEEDVTIEEGNKTEEDVTIEEGNKTEEDVTIEEGNKTEEDVTIEEGNNDVIALVQFKCYGSCTSASTMNVYDKPSSSGELLYEFDYQLLNDAVYLDETEDYYKVYFSGIEGWVQKIESFDSYILTSEPRIALDEQLNSPKRTIKDIEVNALEIDGLMKEQYYNQVKSISNDNLEDIYKEAINPKLATNPSTYKVINGDLQHCYTTAADDSNAPRYCLIVGKAPSQLIEGEEYYSYDGIYFYNTLNAISRGGETAINAKEPHFDYFQYLPARSVSNYSTKDFIQYLNKNGYTDTFTSKDKSVLGYTKDLKEPFGYEEIYTPNCIYSNKVWTSKNGGLCVSNNKSMLLDGINNYKDYEYNYGTNSLLEFSWAVHESAFGRSAISIFKYNYYGMNAVDSNPAEKAWKYTNSNDGMKAHIDYFIYRYAHPEDSRYFGSHLGDKTSGMNVKYASDANWGEKIAGHIYKLDKALGGKDYNYYTLGIVKDSTNLVIRSAPNPSSSYLYDAKAGNNKWTVNYPVLIVGEVGDYYKIKTDVALNAKTMKRPGTKELGVTYDWNSVDSITYGYIPKSYVTYINKTSGEYRDPKNIEANNLRYEYIKFIERSYELILGRYPDSGGLTAWLNRLLDNDITPAELIRNMVESAEFKSKKYSNEVFLDILYRVFFDREADGYGKQSWLEKMKIGITRDYVVVDFANSAEFKAYCENRNIPHSKLEYMHIVDKYSSITEFVYNFYLKSHQRIPDNEGLNSWVSQLSNKSISGQNFALEIFLSQEMTARNLSNEEFVTRVYQSLLMRNPENDGKSAWVANLKKGMSRKDMIIHFTHSSEYENLCNQKGILVR